MKKKKNLFLRILSIFMIFCMSFLLMGASDCPGTENADEEEEESGTSIFGLLGTKVLYRPDHYDYNKNSGGDDENPNIYYAKYAWHIINALYEIYGIIDQTDNRQIRNNSIKYFVEYDQEADFADDGNYMTYSTYMQQHPEYDNVIPYLYDSIRYKVDTLIEVSQKTVDGIADEGFTPYIILGADYNTSWNWSFDANLNNITQNAYLYSDEYFVENTIFPNHVFNNYSSTSDFSSDLSSTYSTPLVKTFYQKTYIGGGDFDEISNEYITATDTDYSLYSDFTKALEYVIYSYALDLEPNQITVTKHDDGIPSYYTLSVQGYANIQEALDERIALFERIASYVGLVDRQITKITNWILDNVIGAKALSNDTFTTYNNVVEVVDAGGNFVRYDLGTGDIGMIGNGIGRNYAETVAKVVQGVCEEVSIGDGGEEGGQINVDERYMASEITEYMGDAFMVQGNDAVFRNDVTNPLLPYIRPYEYQSVTLMFAEDTYVSDIKIALKYDADLDGTSYDDPETAFNKEKYLDIIVDLNYYNHETNTLKSSSSPVIRVYDGPYFVDFTGSFDQEWYGDYVPADHQSGFFFTEIGKEFGLNQDAILVKAFNPDVGGGVTKTDIGESNYEGRIYISQNPLQINGLTNLRKFYQLIESTINEEGVPENHSYITGRLNSEMFAGSDGCDYLELTYRVIKKNGDYDTNYKFYTGIQYLNAISARELEKMNND